MTDKQLWIWMSKSINTCQNVLAKYSDYEKACNNETFYNAQRRFETCAEEFDERGLKSIDFSPYDYNETYFSDFFTDSMA